MSEIISWLKEYSPAVVALLAIGAAALYVLKLTVDKSITAGFDTHLRELELGLERRSAFRDKVLTERFTRIADLSARLERVLTNLNRLRTGSSVPEGFQRGREIVPLTEIYEDLKIYRLILTEEFYALLLKEAHLVLKLAQDMSEDEWNQSAAEWNHLDEQLRAAVEEAFKLSEVKF